MLTATEQKTANRKKIILPTTEIMWLGAGQLLQPVNISTIPVQSSVTRVVQSARDLGVILDRQMSLSDHITAI